MIGVLISRGRDNRDAYAQRKAQVRTRWEGECLQATEKGLQRKQTCQHLDIQLPELWGNTFWFTHQVYFDMAATAN